MTIDADAVDAPVATVAYPYQLTGTGPVNTRTGPSRSYPVVKIRLAGSSVSVVCQAPGSAAGGTRVWDKLTDGSYVSDFYVSTPSATGYSPPVAPCRYPYQVAAAGDYPELHDLQQAGTALLTARLPHRGAATAARARASGPFSGRPLPGYSRCSRGCHQGGQGDGMAAAGRVSRELQL